MGDVWPRIPDDIRNLMERQKLFFLAVRETAAPL
jgi:hypothetical protein